MKKLVASLVLAGALTATATIAAEKPKTVIHVINVRFKKEAAKADIDKALNGAAEMAYPGLKRVWLKGIKNQIAEFPNMIVMEFESEDSLKKYAGSDAQKKWYALYDKVRDESRTNDNTN